MIQFKDRYISSLSTGVMSNFINSQIGFNGGISPIYADILSYANLKFDTLSSQVGEATTKAIVSNPLYIRKELFDNAFYNIQLYITSLLNTPVLDEYIKYTQKYTKITQRFLYSNILANNIVNELSNYSCKHIDVVSDLETSASNTFNIGNYVTLPFCIENVKCYNGQIMVTSAPLDEITFDNFSETNTLPLKNPILVKYIASSGLNKNIITLTCSLVNFTSNVIYINTYGDVDSIAIEGILNNQVVLTDSLNTNEALFTFNTQELNGLRITLTLANYNTNKQASFEISELIILGNVNFAPQATFETKQLEMKDFFNINKIQINAINYKTGSVFNKYISMSLDEASKNFFQIDDISGSYIPSAKYTYTKKYILDMYADQFLIKVVPAGTTQEITERFYKYAITQTPGSTFNFKQAKVLLGTNDAYGTDKLPLSPDGKIFENWSKIDNFYRTMVLNNEENVFIDIGLNQIKINGVTVSGIVNMPVGISMIDVHESLFDPSFGHDLNYESVNGLATDEYFYGDKLYPYNFAYKLAGLPTYTNGTINRDSMSAVDIVGTTIVHLDSPALPLTITVDGTVDSYSLHLGSIPVNPGTFTIEPHKGIVRIHAYKNQSDKYEDTVTITYTKTSNEIKPVGVLFNRVATYIDYKSVFNLLSIFGSAGYDSTFFSYMSDTLLIPHIEPAKEYLRPYHHKILHNMYESRLFVSTRFALTTNNTNISPAIKDIFIQGYTQ